MAEYKKRSMNSDSEEKPLGKTIRQFYSKE